VQQARSDLHPVLEIMRVLLVLMTTELRCTGDSAAESMLIISHLGVVADHQGATIDRPGAASDR
jgi:hypothetical protein